MVSGPESSRSPSGGRVADGSNQRGGGGASAEAPSEQELGALFDQAMKAQQRESGGGKGITPEEQQKFLSAMKDPEFRSLLNDYMQEISDPKNRAETEQYLSQLESEQRVPEDKELIKPVPGFVVKSRWSHGTSGSKVFVNVCSSGKLQPPSSTRVTQAGGTAGTSWHLPYSVGPERMESDKGGASAVTFDVCFHTQTLALATRQRPFLDMVVKICLDAVETLLRDSRRAPTGELSRKSHILKGVTYKSGDPVTMCLRKSAANSRDSKRVLSRGAEEKEEWIKDTSDALHSSPADGPQQPRGRAKEKERQDSHASNQRDVIDVVVPEPNTATSSASDKLLETSEEDAGPLLREVATTKTAKAAASEPTNRKLRFQMIYRGKFELMHHMQAEHGKMVPADRHRPKELVVEVEFPLATSAKGISLDVSEAVVRVCADQYDALSIPLPYKVLEAKGSAKFDKKRRVLVITLPVQPPPPPEPKSVSIAVEEEGEGVDEDKEDEDKEDEDNEDEKPSGDIPEESTRSQPAPPVRMASPLPKHDEFRMLRETALMVTNDPLFMARTTSQVACSVASTEAAYEDMPPLESCSEDEDEDEATDGMDARVAAAKDGQHAHDEPTALPSPLSSPTRTRTRTQTQIRASADDEPEVSTPSFTSKETSACVSFLIAVPNVRAASVKLSFPSPTSMQLRFTASSAAAHVDSSSSSSSNHIDLEMKTYAMATSLPHAVRPETAEVDVATENMVVILEKTASSSSRSPCASEPLSAPVLAPSVGVIDPVARFQNDLLYELD